MEYKGFTYTPTPKTAWDNLSMLEKSEMMKVAVRNGITDLKTIKEQYNEFAEGGDTKPDWSYDSWKRQIAEHMGIRPDEDNTYDYEAYFNKYPEEAWKMLKGDPTAHLTDEFKTVYHPTFSSKSIGNDGSIYSGVRNPKTNPQGLVGGTWSPDYKVFTMSPDGYRGPVSMDDRKWYLENAEDNGVQLREADGSLPIYDGIPWGGVLPNVTITGNRFANGGGIHIKDSKKGTFTAAAKKHGKSVQAFASQVLAHPENYSPAMRKKANFARNAAKWHGEGGNLFDGTSEDIQQIQIGRPFWQSQTQEPTFMESLAEFNRQQEIKKQRQRQTLREKINTVGRKMAEERIRESSIESNDNAWIDNKLTHKKKNSHLSRKTEEGAKQHATWEKEHPNLTAWGNVAGVIPFAVAVAPMLEAAASSTAGQGITTGLNYIANATKAAPYVSKVLPWTEAALATGSTTHGIQEMQEGVFTPMTALEVSPLVPITVGIGNNLYLPHLREHIYASKAPIGYDGMLPAAKRIAEGVLSGKRADIENPFWFNNESAETLAKEFAFVPKNISEADKIQYIKDFGQRALRARADIWRMYNRLPQKYNTFVKSERYPGTYTAPEDIKALKWVPFPDKNVDPGDFVNSVGGNVGLPNIINLGKGLPDAGYTSKEFGVTTLSDLWDLHPFSRPNDRLISRIQRGYKEAFNTTEAPEFKWLKPLDERLAKFEVGKLINAKPIMVKNDVPWTMDRKLITDANGNLNFRTSYTQGFHSDNIIPQSVIDWKAGKPIIEDSDIQLNPDSYNFLRAKLTTKSRRKNEYI